MKKLKKLLAVMALTVACQFSFAQSEEGVISYETRINMHRQLSADQQGRRAMEPEFRISKNEMLFNANTSLFKPVIEEDEDEAAGGGQRRRFQPRTQYYIDQSGERVIIAQNIRGKDYLIQDSIKVSPWKFGNESKVILGYTCKQAFYTDSTKKVVTAWYTDKLRPFLGPERYNTLPGAVLAVDVNNAERVIVATKVQTRPLKKDELTEPTKGEKITPAEFRKLMREQFQNMRNRPRN